MNYTSGSTIKVRLNVKVKADGTETKGVTRVLTVRSHVNDLITGDVKVNGVPVTVEVNVSRVVTDAPVSAVEVDPNPVPVLDVEDAIAHLSDVCDLPPIDVLSGLVAGFDLIGPGHIYRMTSDGRVAIYVSLLKPSDFSY